MSGWDFDKPTESKREFTKFPVGITRIRVLDDVPHQRWTHWHNKSNRSFNCPGKSCPICEIRRQQKDAGEKTTHAMSRRISMNVLNRETGKLEIMEQGVNFFEDLRDLRADLEEENKSLIDVDIKVRRRGTGKDDTSYRLDIDEEYPLTEKELELVKEKANLKEFFEPHTPEQIVRVLNGEEWDEVMYPKEEEEIEQDESDEEFELE